MLSAADARDLVKAEVGATLDPALTDAEIDAILTETRRGDVWAAGTAYSYGAVGMPTVRNGHAYVVVVAGTSSSTEPTWPRTAASSVSDGTVTWREAGADWGELYDIRRAVYQAYRRKLAKAQDYLTVGGDGQTVNLQQIVQNLEAQARRWQPVSLA
jgi:hypothetical protein